MKRKDSGYRLAGLFLVLAVFCVPLQAQLYKWVDADGTVHYGDSPPEDVSLKRINGELSSYTNVSVEIRLSCRSQQESGNIGGEKPVVMYSTEWCGYCRKARRHFRQSNGIAFTELDIEKSANARRRAFKESERSRGSGNSDRQPAHERVQRQHLQSPLQRQLLRFSIQRAFRRRRPGADSTLVLFQRK